ncbi:hypothetical protein [Lichenicoccus sp.]|uniref:hypothetical protein n=1 Tax=Lichenicoccus sp. TaxID=2781899 RepID=UPI003D0BB9B0
MPFLATIRSLVIALVVLGLSASSMAYAKPASMGPMIVGPEQGQAAAMPCGMTMSAADTAHGKPMMPCKTINSDCTKQLVCTTDVAVPARFALAVHMDQFDSVEYWSPGSSLASVSLTPEPLPPRTV